MCELNDDPITWQRLRAIFGHPPLVMNVTESQFDYNDGKLAALGRTPYDEIDFGDLWYHHHDLASDWVAAAMGLPSEIGAQRAVIGTEDCGLRFQD